MKTAQRVKIHAKKASSEPTNTGWFTLLKNALNEAHQTGAKALSFEPGETTAIITLHFESKAVVMSEQHKSIHADIAQFLKASAKLQPSTPHVQQVGWINTAGPKSYRPVRITTTPSYHGERILLEPVFESSPVASLDHIGMQLGTQYIVRKHLAAPRGLIVIVGTDQTATKEILSVLIQILNQDKHNVTTLEENIQKNIPSVNQIELPSTEYDLKSTFIQQLERQDIDVLGIENANEPQALEAAASLALSGALVLATVYADNALEVLTMFNDLEMDNQLIANALRLIIEQSTLNQSSPFVAEPKLLDKTDITHIKKLIDPSRLLHIIRKETGSDIHSLYDVALYRQPIVARQHHLYGQKRMNVYSAVEIGEKIQQLLATDANAKKLNRALKAQPNLTRLEDAFLKALQGQTTLEAIWAEFTP